MSLGEKIRELRRKKKMTQTDLALQIGVGKSTISDWEKNKTSPDIGKMESLANILGVDLSAFIQTGMENLTRPVFEDEDERSLIWAYRELDPWEKEFIRHTMDTVSELHYQRAKLNKQITNVSSSYDEPDVWSDIINVSDYIEPRFFGRVSAGTGHALMEDFTDETIRIRKSNLTGKTDYVIQVDGDSMNPKFKNGDYLLVQKQPMIEDGEIGIFYQDGETYVKEKRGNVLHSLNPNYSDIPIVEETRCFGKVLGKAEI